MITKTFKTVIIQTDANNIIKAVRWNYIFSDGVNESIADGRTIITHAEVDATTNPDIESLVLNEVGVEAMQGIIGHHEYTLKDKAISENLVDYYVSPDYVCDTSIEQPNI